MLQATLGMRAQTHQLDHIVRGLSIDQSQVGLDVAVTMVASRAGQRVIPMFLSKRLILRQCRHNSDEVGFERVAMSFLCLVPVITFERAGAFNPSHSNQP